MKKWWNIVSWFKSKPTEQELDTEIDEDAIEGKFLLIQAGFEDDGRLRIEVEYDEVFVENLRQRGYVGVDPQQVVMMYVGDVYRTIAANSEARSYD